MRALCQIAGEGSLCRGFADDLALGLKHLWSRGLGVANLFAFFRTLSGLDLSPSKCILIPLWPGNFRNIKNLVREYIPQWSCFTIAGCGKYLGTWIGPLAGHKPWDEPLKKYRSRCLMLANMSQGVWCTALLYRVFCLPVLSFLMQLNNVPNSVLECEAEMMKRFIPGPAKWLRNDVMHALPEVFGFDATFPSIRVYNQTILARTACLTLSNCDQHGACLRAIVWQDAAILSHPWRQWQTNSMLQLYCDILSCLHKWRIYSEGQFVCPNIRESAIRKRSGTQRLLFNAIQGASDPPPAFEHIFRSRVDRWYRQDIIKLSPGISTRRAPHILNILHRRCPLCVVWAVIRTWFNGWCTGRRFQCQDTACRLCTLCRGNDSIEHYLCCPVVVDFCQRKLRLTIKDKSTLMILDLGIGNEDELIASALGLYAAYSPVNVFRTQGEKT